MNGTSENSEDERLAEILEKNVDAMLVVDGTHQHQQSSTQKAVESLGKSFETPAFFLGIAVVVLSWIGVNMYGGRIGIAQFDAPPFLWLQGTISLASLITMLVVLIRQRGKAEWDRRQDQVELQLIMLTEQKVAKLIELIEELRRDLPSVENRHDAQAEAFSKTIHPRDVVSTLEQNSSNKK